MKLALSGTEGTGKTTIVKAINKKYGIPIIPEFAREVAEEMGIKSIRKMDYEQSYKFQTEILKRKIEEESKRDVFIADRSTADNLAYYLRWVCREIDDTRNEEYYHKCIAQLKNYDKVVFLKWDFVIRDDGFRSTRKYYIYEMDCLVRGILAENEINYEIVEESNLENKIDYISGFFETCLEEDRTIIKDIPYF